MHMERWEGCFKRNREDARGLRRTRGRAVLKVLKVLKGEYKQRLGAASKRKAWRRHGRGTQQQDTQGSGL